MREHDDLIIDMMDYFAGDPARIHHFMKVLSYTRLIAHGEELTEEECFLLETTAILLDVGMKVCEQEYNSREDKYLRIESPKLAEKMLSDLGYAEDFIEKVKGLIDFHHSLEETDDIYSRILYEADFLVNIHEEEHDAMTIRIIYSNIFYTDTGKELCLKLYKYAF